MHQKKGEKMRTKHRQLRDWVWTSMAIGVFVFAIIASGLIEKWL